MFYSGVSNYKNETVKGFISVHRLMLCNRLAFYLQVSNYDKQTVKGAELDGKREEKSEEQENDQI